MLISPETASRNIYPIIVSLKIFNVNDKTMNFWKIWKSTASVIKNRAEFNAHGSYYTKISPSNTPGEKNSV